MRSNRVRSLLGLNHTSSNEENISDQAKVNAQQNKQQRRPPNVTPSSAIVSDTEASVLATFEFLNDQRDGNAGRNPGSTDDEEEVEEDEDDMVDDTDGELL